MSDISIPGVTASKYKTDELIQGLMKVERVPRDRAEEELKTYRSQQSAWRGVNQHAGKLRDTSRSLFSYNNPFNEKIAESTDPRAVTASANREAQDQRFRLTVNQIAQADSFLSSELPSEGKVSKGRYVFNVGDSEIAFNWKGGSYREFIDALNRRGKDVLRASLVQVSPTTRSLLIESLKTGANERLKFSEDALRFALESGIIKKNDQGVISVTPSSITAKPGSNAVTAFSATARAKDGLVLQYRVSVSDTPAPETTTEDTSAVSTASGSIQFSGITIQNNPSELPVDAPLATTPKAPVEDNQVLSLRSTRGAAIPLPAATLQAESSIVRVPLSEFGDVDALLVHNKNTHRTVTVEDIAIIDPKVAGDYIPVNPVSVAQDALIKYEGITITRPTNTIEDLVPGVTINLHEATAKQETLTVKPDVETAKESIISFVGNYNRLMAELNILTQKRPEIIQEIGYFTPDESKAAEEKLGMMLGDTTLNGIKASLQRITTNLYVSSDTSSIRSLAELGISTKSGTGGGLDSTRLRGYLEIDEKKLDAALDARMNEVKTLFGFDSDGDLIIDNGLAHSMDNALAPYVQTGGIFATRTSGLDNRISTTEKKITRLDEQLEAKERELKIKYGQMEGTLNSLQQQSNSIQNFNNQNTRNQ